MVVEDDIKNMKEELREEAEKRGISENFGQKKVNELERKYNYYDIRYSNNSEDKLTVQKIDRFDEWCKNFGINDLEVD